jgi:ferredoxin
MPIEPPSADPMTPATGHVSPVSTSAPIARRLPAVDPERCTGCGRCVGVCPPHVLSLHTVRWDKHAALDDAAGCTGCAACAVVCPFHAILMRPAPSPLSPQIQPQVQPDVASHDHSTQDLGPTSA